MIKKFIDDNKDNILNNICELIKIPGISDESSAENGMPFGKNCSDALNYILNLADSLGFKTKNAVRQFFVLCFWQPRSGRQIQMKILMRQCNFIKTGG